ncbi:D-alanyl-D-alanine carboxypeptidase [Streptomyces sp. B6B3]|uniref:D-alanyl-D-alanine carboxypeptidase n=1 Tax=Streptomyces sp. B6B3 TaxID=3153570 RepID=UPI00325E3A84
MAGESPDISGRDRERASTIEGGQSPEKTPETPDRVPRAATDPEDDASESAADAPSANGARDASPAELIPGPATPADDAGEPVPRAEPAPGAASGGTSGTIGAQRSGDSAEAPPAAGNDDEAPQAPTEPAEPAEPADDSADSQDPKDPADPADDTADSADGADDTDNSADDADDAVDDADDSTDPADDSTDPADDSGGATGAGAAPPAAPAEPSGAPRDPREPAPARKPAESPTDGTDGDTGDDTGDGAPKPSPETGAPAREEDGDPDAAVSAAGAAERRATPPTPAKPPEAPASAPSGPPSGPPAAGSEAARKAGRDDAAAGSGRRPGGVVDRPTTALRVGGSGTAAPPPPAAPPRPTAAPPPADADRDPMELLAALTNRPAPPPTPLRVLLRRLKIWTPLAVLLLIVFVVAQSLRPLPDPGLEVTAAESFTFDGESPSVPWPETGQAALGVQGIGSFGQSGGSEPVPIASVAKVMTAYLLLQEHPLEPGEQGPGIEIDQRAEEEAGLSESDSESTVEVREGDSISEYEALQAILIASANNVARLVARWVSDSEEDFIEQMNETAAELGMENTTYTDPSGLEPETVSTAADQVLLAEAAMADPVFREIVGVSMYEDSYDQEHGNWNYLVPVDGVVGIKTGTTTAAGGCLMFAAEQEVDGERRLILGAVLGQPPHPTDNSILTGALTAGEELMDFAQDELVSERVFQAGDVVGEVDDGLGGTTPVTVTEDVTAVGWPGLEVRVELEESYRDPESEDGDATGPLPHSADADTPVGRLLVGDGDGGVSVPVALAEDLVEPGFGARLLRLG